jgi:hypothetical protein
MSPVRRGLEAAKANFIPGLLLQILAMGLLLSYYFYPPAREFFTSISEFKSRCGLPFPFISTAIFGAALPFALQFLQKDATKHEKTRHLPVLLLYWGYKGVEVELLYRAQAWVFGDGNTFSVILPKVLFDQLIYCPVWAVPTMVMFYCWKDCDFSLSRMWAKIRPNFIKNQVIPIQIPSWLVWLPAVAIIYCLPTPLQLPMQNIVLCLWVLLLVFLSKSHRD